MLGLVFGVCCLISQVVLRSACAHREAHFHIRLIHISFRPVPFFLGRRNVWPREPPGDRQSDLQPVDVIVRPLLRDGIPAELWLTGAAR